MFGRPRKPPRNIDAEQQVLGAILLDPASIDDVSSILDPDDFYQESHRDIFRCMLDLASRSPLVIDAPSLDGLGCDGDYAYALRGAVASAANIVAHAELVKDCSTRRRLVALCDHIKARAEEEPGAGGPILEYAQESLMDLGTVKEDDSRDSLDLMLDRAEAVKASGRGISGLATGYYKLDMNTSGLQPGALIILAARTSMGKTTLAQNICRNVCKNGGHVGFVTLEMSPEELWQRFVVAEADVEYGRLRNGTLDDADYKKMLDTALEIKGTWGPYLHVDRKSSTSVRVRSSVRQWQRKYGLSLLIVDYLQLMSHPSSGQGNRQEEVSAISRELKAIAMDFGIPVLALAQVRRLRDGEDGEPALSDLRESGAIEQDADVVIFIHRKRNDKDDYTSRLTTLIVAKQRNGPIGKAQDYLDFDSSHMVFKEMYKEKKRT